MILSEISIFTPTDPVSSSSPQQPQLTEGMNTLPTESTTAPYYIGWDGNPMGYLYSVSRVREVLNSTGFFDSDEVEEWNREIVVPFGTSPFDFICTVVGKEGFSIRALYCGGRWTAVSPMLPLDKLAKRNTENGFYPKIRGKRSDPCRRCPDMSSDNSLSRRSITDIPPEVGFDDLLLTPLILHCHSGVDSSWASPAYSWIIDRADKL